MKKSIGGAIQVLLIAVLLMATIITGDMTSTTKGQQIAVNSMSTSTNENNPVVFIRFHDDNVVDDIRRSSLKFLEETKADVVYGPLTSWGDSVDMVQSHWSQNGLFIQECHKMSIKVIAVISACILQPIEFNSTFISSATTRNASGQIILQYQGSGIPPYYHGCLNHLVWREHLFQVAKVAVDLGIDGIQFDETTRSGWWDTGECYADECIGQFKEYLQTKYTPNELHSKFGINDISSFNYRAYLSSKGLLYVDEHERLGGSDPLGREYYVFELSTLARSFKELTSRIKDYAQKANGRDIIIVANQFELSSDNLIDYPYVDFLSIGTCFNVWYIDKDRQEGRKYYQPYYTASPFILLARGLDSRKQALMSPDIVSYADVNLTSTVAKIIMGEAYASGGYYNQPFYSGTDYGPIDALINFSSFIRRYSGFFQTSFHPCDVALFTPYTTMLWIDGFSQQIYGASQILVDAHIPFDMLFTGDGNVLPDTLTLGDLMKYKAIYLPDILGLSDGQVNLLKEYLSRGGKLLITGLCGIHDEMRNYRPSSPFDSLHNHPNVTYIQWEDDVWMDWVPYSDYKATKDPAMRDQIFNAIKDLLRGEFILETNASSRVGISISFQKEENRLLVHFVNYDYHIENDTVTEQENIHVKIKKPEGFNASNAESLYFSPDAGLDPRELKCSILGDYIEFTIPKLRTYSIALIGSAYRPALAVKVMASPTIIYSQGALTISIDVDSGTPITGAIITLASDRGGNLSPAMDHDNGTYTATFTAPAIAAQTTCTIAASASKSGYTIGWGQTEVTLQPLILNIYVKGSSGNPLVGTTVVSTYQPSGQAALSGTTDADGLIAFAGILKGSYTIKASKSGYEDNTWTGTVAGGEATTQTITLTTPFPWTLVVMGMIIVALSSILLMRRRGSRATSLTIIRFARRTERNYSR